MPTTVKQFVLQIASDIEKQSQHVERLNTNCSVRLRRLMRSMTDSDRYGWFSPVSGAWQDVDSSQLYTTNIVKPTIRTNASAMMTANVKIDILPRRMKDTRAQMASEVATAVFEQDERLQWDDNLEQYLAMEQQLGAGVFIKTFLDKSKKRTHKIPKWETEEEKFEGTGVCGECGAEFPADGEVDEVVQCAVCGGQAIIAEASEIRELDVETGYSEFSTGEVCTQVIPFFQFRIDDIATQGGNLEAARWFEHHYYEALDDLQLKYPESKDDIAGAKMNASYSLQWERALKRNYSSPTDGQSENVIQEREVRDIFLTPPMYLNHKFDQDLTLKDKEGNVRFKIKKGQTFAEAEYEGKVCDCPPTICLRLVGTALLDVFISDFKKEYQYAVFLMNPDAFWGFFLYEVVALQDIITYLVSLQFYHIKRNAITSIIYNRSSFDPKDLSKDLIPTKQALPFDVPIQSQFGIVPALALSGEPMQLFETIMALKGDVTLTTPAMMGQAQPNEPYAAQALQKQSSMGLLAPAETSKAQAKVKWAKQVLRLRQQYWTEEDTEQYLSMNPEWTEDFIEAFLKSDLDVDFAIDYKQGTEIPQSLIEREIKLQNLLQQIMMVGQIDPSFVQTDALKEIITELIQSTGLTIDVGNNESNLRLAESRFDHLTNLLKGISATDNMQVIQQVAAEITSLPIFQPLPYETFSIIKEFYADKARNEASRVEPNYLLLACLNNLIQIEDAGTVDHAQEQSEMQMQAGAPMIEAQQQMEMAQEQAKVEGQMALQEAQANNPDAQINFDNDERQREADMLMQDKELMNAEAERKATLEQARLQNRAKEAKKQ